MNICSEQAERLYHSARNLLDRIEFLPPVDREYLCPYVADLASALTHAAAAAPIEVTDDVVPRRRRRVPPVPYVVRQGAKLILASTLALPVAIAFEIGRHVVEKKLAARA